MKALNIIAALTLPLGGVVAAHAYGPEEMPATPHQEKVVEGTTSDLFNKLDSNRDQLVSLAEAHPVSALSKNWSRYDGNGDGSLDPREFSAFEQSAANAANTTGMSPATPTENEMPATRHQEQALQGDLAKRLDKDGDGLVSRQEAQAEASVASNWNRLDKNRDGRLDARELAHTNQ